MNVKAILLILVTHVRVIHVVPRLATAKRVVARHAMIPVEPPASLLVRILASIRVVVGVAIPAALHVSITATWLPSAIRAPAFAKTKLKLRPPAPVQPLAATHAATPVAIPAVPHALRHVRIHATRPVRTLVWKHVAQPALEPAAEHAPIHVATPVQIPAARLVLLHVAPRVPIPVEIHVIKHVL